MFIWVSSYAKPPKNSNLFFTNRRLILASVYNLKLRFGKTMTFVFIALNPSRRFTVRTTFQC